MEISFRISYTVFMERYYYLLDNGDYIRKPLWPGMTFLDAKQEAGNKTAICALRNRELESLGKEINEGDYVKFLASNESENASRVFLRGATFLLHIAAYELEYEFLVEHVLYGGVFCRMDDADNEKIKKLQEKVDEYIAQDREFTFTMVDIERAKQLLTKEGMTQQVRLLKFRPFDYFRLYWYNGHAGYFHGIMPPSSGYLKGAELKAYEGGFMLRIPTPYKSAAKTIENQPKYLEVFREAEKQAEQLSSSYIADLNEHFLSGEIEDIIKADEKFHKDMIDGIADTIIKSDTARVVLIAGPSSSGKTTFARRLALALDAKGKGSLPVSIDDYYRDRDDIQADISGEKDFETLSAIDTQKLEEDMLTLLAGGTADLPEFDFVTGVRKEQPKKTNIGDELIIIEGIHGLNDKLLTGLDRKFKFKIFVSPLTALNFDTRSVVLPEEIRLLRRLARDKRTRGFSFSDTFARWFSVRKGEYKYILPYQESADVMFNTMLLYEPLVLKKYCYEELQKIPNTDSGYVRAQSMLKFLNYFLSLEDESAIPKDSLVREFIGGGLVQ